MTTRYPAARRATEARALTVALAIAHKAGWNVAPAGPALSTPFSGYLYVAAAELLLVPTSADLPFAVRLAEQATREARSDALVVSFTGQDEAGPVRLALGLWSSAGTRWTAPAQPWLGNDGTLWLGSDRIRATSLRPRRIAAEPVPWRTLLARQDGEARAAGWLERVLA